MKEDENLDLGRFELCLDVADIRRSLDFYEKLGFRQVAGDVEERNVVLQKGDCRLALYQGYIKGNLLNFRGGDVFAIAAALKQQGLAFKKEAFTAEDGSAGALLEDPDGNEIYFVSHPGETPAAPQE